MGVVFREMPAFPGLFLVECKDMRQNSLLRHRFFHMRLFDVRNHQKRIYKYRIIAMLFVNDALGKALFMRVFASLSRSESAIDNGFIVIR